MAPEGPRPGESDPWERLAPWYVDHVRHSDNHTIARRTVLDLAGTPAATRGAGAVAGPDDGRSGAGRLDPGTVVLDIGCGEGHVSRALAAAGGEVTGVDRSGRLVAAARATPTVGARPPRYEIDDARTLATIDDRTCDLLVACLSFNDVDDLGAAVDAATRVAAPDARAVVVIPHPCFEAPHSRWVELPPAEQATEGADDDTGARPDSDTGWYRAVPDGYLRPGYWVSGRPGTVRGEAGNHHRPLSTYIAAFADRGWVCRRLVEPEPKAALPPGTPNLLALRFDRPGSATTVAE